MSQLSKTTERTPLRKGRFDLFIPIGSMSASVITKELDGVARKYLRGIASSTTKDRENDVVTPEFLSKMKTQAMGLTVFKEHKWDIDSTLGFIATVDGDERNMIIETLLEPEDTNAEVTKILQKLAHGTKLGYSIGGYLTKTKKVKGQDGSTYRQLDDGELVEVSVTAMPANTDTWVTALEKSLSEFPDTDASDDEASAGQSGQLASQESNTMTGSAIDDTPAEVVVKILDEIMEQSALQDKLWEMFWVFRSVIGDTLYNTNLDPAQKRAAIETVSAEFAMKVEEISTTIAELVETVASDIAGETVTV